MTWLGYMRASILTVLLSGVLAVALAANISEHRVGSDLRKGIWISDARMPKLPPVSRVASIFLTIHNSGDQADRLVAISTPVAEQAELHISEFNDGVYGMRPVAAVSLLVGETLALRSGSFHIMLMGLRHDLMPATEVPLRLTFERAGSIDIRVPRVSVADAFATGAGTPDGGPSSGPGLHHH